MSTIPTTLLSDLLDPLAQCFTPAVAQEVANLRFDPAAQKKLEELRQKANEGILSAQEQVQYEAIVETADVIAVLQAKSKELLQDYAEQSAEATAPTHLSARDRDIFLAMLDAAPEPNQTLSEAFARRDNSRG